MTWFFCYKVFRKITSKGSVLCSVGVIICMASLQYSFNARIVDDFIPKYIDTGTVVSLMHMNSQTKVRVLIAHPSHGDQRGMKRFNHLQALILSNSFEPWSMESEQRRQFLWESGRKCYDKGEGSNHVLRVYDSLVSKPHQQHLAEELWKYCVLTVELQNSCSYAAAYLHGDTPLLFSMDTFDPLSNYAVAGDDRYNDKTMHASLLILQKDKTYVSREMVNTIVESDGEQLPMLLPRKLYDIINTSYTLGSLFPIDDWKILKQHCHTGDLMGKGHSNQHLGLCPKADGYCCDIISTDANSNGRVVMLTRYVRMPHQVLPNLPDYNASLILSDQGQHKWPFVTTIEEKNVHRNNTEAIYTSNFYDFLHKIRCVPFSHKKCEKCMKSDIGRCSVCHNVCRCFCHYLCRKKAPKKVIKKILYAIPPRYKRDPNRFIPRIVHQTYFENITEDKYPNMSRLVEAWKRSGWEYNFYSDDDSRNFIKNHFPHEVLEAYDDLIPGAFKADLFRYCALFVNGGIYADVDLLLETKLDMAIKPDIGFMIPIDLPGEKTGTRMCLWNGFIAASPGHPFLAKAIEMVVNNVRNRFTAVDVMNTLCPDPDFSVSHKFNILFTSGPCILGAAVNAVLKRAPQTQFECGTLSMKISDVDIPGRSIILLQNKKDMGSHRFTFEEYNLLIGSTDMKDLSDSGEYDERLHYSETHGKHPVYGVEGVYRGGITKKANEDIQIILETPSIDTTRNVN